MAERPAPLDLLARWVAEAGRSTMTLATADADGTPHARTVVVTAIDTGAGTLRFHSSAPTTKTRDLTVNPRVSGVFHWPEHGRQVVLHGTAHELPAAVSRAAFPTRPRQLQLLAWAYDALDADVPYPQGRVEEAFADALHRDERAMPASWTTFEGVPRRMAFWRAGGALTPPSRTSYRVGDGGWDPHAVLP